MFQWLVLWFAFNGALFVNQNTIPEQVVAESYGRGFPQPLKNSVSYVLSTWNMEEVSSTEALKDLARLVNESDFVQTRNQLLNSPQIDQVEAFSNFHWSLVKSFHDKIDWQGLVTVSRWRPLQSWALRSPHRELFFNTPRVSSISVYPLEKEGALWIVNVDLLRKIWNLSDYQEQLYELSVQVQAHPGPLLITGNFASWSEERRQVLEAFLEGLQLEHLDQAPSLHTGHESVIFYRGVQILSVLQKQEVTSAIEAPLQVEFTLLPNPSLSAF